MLRELATVLVELHDSLAGMNAAGAAGLRLAAVEMTLPMDVRPVLRNGGCVLLGDLPRTPADAAWRDPVVGPSRLYLRWVAEARADGANGASA